jgi:hypothetical protein
MSSDHHDPGEKGKGFYLRDEEIHRGDAVMLDPRDAARTFTTDVPPAISRHESQLKISHKGHKEHKEHKEE